MMSFSPLDGLSWHEILPISNAFFFFECLWFHPTLKYFSTTAARVGLLSWCPKLDTRRTIWREIRWQWLASASLDLGDCQSLPPYFSPTFHEVYKLVPIVSRGTCIILFHVAWPPNVYNYWRARCIRRGFPMHWRIAYCQMLKILNWNAILLFHNKLLLQS